MKYFLPDGVYDVLKWLGLIACPALAVFYLVIPLRTERHQTLGQKVNSIRPVSAEDLFSITKKQILLRFLVFALFYFYLPLLLLFTVGAHAVVLLLLLIVFNITFKYHRGVQDLLSSTMMIDIRKENTGVSAWK